MGLVKNFVKPRKSEAQVDEELQKRFKSFLRKGKARKKGTRNKPVTRAWASSFYDMCPRQTVLRFWEYAATGVDAVSTSIDFRGALSMEMGTVAHSVIQNEFLGRAGLLYGTWVNPENGDQISNCTREYPHTVYEEPYFNDLRYRISGRIDGLIMPEGGEFKPSEACYLEIKTTSATSFARIQYPENIPPYYQIQAEIYLQCGPLGSHRPVWFMFVNRDNPQQTRIVQYTTTKINRDFIRNKCNLIWGSIRDKVLPENTLCDTAKADRAKGCSACEACFDERVFQQHLEKATNESTYYDADLQKFAASWENL